MKRGIGKNKQQIVKPVKMDEFDVDFRVGWQLPVSNPDLDFYEMDIYFRMQDEAVRVFGQDAVVLYQLGSFYEVYGRVDNDVDNDRMDAYSECCNIADGVTKKTGIPTKRMSPPRMMGFSDKAIDKYRSILLNAGWTVVMVSQDKNSSGKKTLREITEIVSGSTHEDFNGSSYTISSIYVEAVPMSGSGSQVKYYSLGYASIDTTTGRVNLNEITETKSHLQDYLNRLLLSNEPNEVFLCSPEAYSLFEWSLYVTRDIDLSKDDVKINEIFNTVLVHIDGKSPSKLNFKERQSIREKVGIASDITKEGIIAFGSIVRYLVKQKPEVVRLVRCHSDASYCVLYGSAIEQLSVFPKRSFSMRSQCIPSQRVKCDQRWDSLFSLMNMCCTRQGSRMLQFRLANPSIDIGEIEGWHNDVGVLQQGSMMTEIRKVIHGSLDGERVMRRLETKLMISPSLVLQLWRFVEVWRDVYDMLNKSDAHKALTVDLEFDWESILKHLSETFVREALEENRASRWDIPISFNSRYESQLKQHRESWDNRIAYIRSIMEIPSSNVSSVKLCSNEKDGYTLTAPKSKSKLIGKWQKEDVTNPDPLLQELREVKVTNMASNSRVSHSTWKQNWVNYENLCMQIHGENQSFLNDWIVDFWEKYGEVCQDLVAWSSKIDVQSTFAMLSARYGYHKPTIIDNSAAVASSASTVIVGKDLRHPMIERLQEDMVGYVENDVEITRDNLGLLLYGMNASGKSSYMKSVGLALIMSQAGCWVPCRDCSHTIMKKIFTRISGNDDYMRGKSSFALEMEELRTILDEADSDSIVLGDELCRGTEYISGTSIVGAGIHTLLTKHVPFVFATHLHTIPQLSLLQDHIREKRLLVKHLRVIFDKVSNTLVYERKLTEGQGSTMYGIEVASVLGLDVDTVKNAMDIREELLGFKAKISRYSSGKVIKVCEVCGENPAVETHHIREQHTADKHKVVDGKQRLHAMSNLVGICESCHDKHHQGKLEIVGWVETSDGMVLDVKQ